MFFFCCCFVFVFVFFWSPQPQNVLNLFYFLINFSLVALLKNWSYIKSVQYLLLFHHRHLHFIELHGKSVIHSILLFIMFHISSRSLHLCIYFNFLININLTEKNNFKMTIKFFKLTWILNQQRSLNCKTSLMIMGTGKRSFTILSPGPSKIFELDNKISFDNKIMSSLWDIVIFLYNTISK